jgi:uncharacterized protein involved in exopolysaccharide biosynthesis
VESIQLDSGELAQEPQADLASALLIPLARSRWLFLSVALLGAAAGIAFGIVQPNSYVSTGKLLVRHSAREEVTPETVIAGPGGQAYGQTNDLVNNEIQLLAVPLVFERVARDVTPPRIYSSYDPTAEDRKETPPALRLFHRFQSWWFRRASAEQASKIGHTLDGCPACVSETAHALMKEIELNAEPMSSVITVSYASHDPALARQVVGAFLTAAEERHREAYSTNTTLAFVNERLQESLSQVQVAETEFTAYRQTCEVFDYDSQRQQLMTLAQDLEKQAADYGSKLAELRSRSTALTALLAAQPATMSQEVERAPVPNPRWTFLQQRLVELQDKLDDLRTRVGGTTEDRKTELALIEGRIQSIQGELKEQPALIEQTPVQQSVPDPRHQRLTQALDELTQDIAAQETLTSKATDWLASVRLRLVATEQCEPRYRFLEATTKNAKANYDALVKAHERTNLMNLLEQVEFSNLRRIQEPTLPLEKEGPKRIKFLIIGLLMGALAGAALAFARHHLDPFVRSPAEVERLLGLRVVGVLPRSRLPRRLRRTLRHAAL